jgi:hypothetical protein
VDIQICQSCGIIIRGKSKFCTGCGATISKFSPTTLPVIVQTATPLAVGLEPDPIVLERAMNRVQYSRVMERGEDFAMGGNGGNGYGSHEQGPGGGGTATATAEYPTDHFQPGSSGNAGVQATSKLQTILGGATANAGQTVAELVSYTGDEDADSFADQYAPPAPDAEDSIGKSFSAVPGVSGEAYAPDGESSGIEDYDIEGPAPAASESEFQPAQGSLFNAIPASAAAAIASAGIFGDGGQPVTVTAATTTPAGIAPAAAEPAGNVDVDGEPEPFDDSAEEPLPAPVTFNPAKRPDFFAQGEDAEPVAVRPEVESITPPPSAIPASDSSAAPLLSFHKPPSAVPMQKEEPSALPPSSTSSGLTPVASAVAVPPSEPLKVVSDSATKAGAPVSPNSSNTSAPSSPSAPIPHFNARSAGFNPVAGAGGSDFFGPGAVAPQAAESEAATRLSEKALKLKEALDLKEALELKEAAEIEQEPEVDVPEGTPEIVAQAIRAAAKQSAADERKIAADRSEDKATTKSKNGKSASGKSSDKKSDKILGEEPEEEEPPKRRSFSGKGSSSGSTKSSSKTQKNKSSDSGSDAKRRRQSGSDDENASEKEEPLLKIGDFKLTKKALTTYGIMAAGVMLLLIVASMTIGALFGGGGRAGSGVTTLAGTWQIGAADTRGGKVIANCFLDQTVNSLTGKGVDPYGNFAIVQGTYNHPKVQFLKVYIDKNGKPLAKPIQYQGVVDWINPEPGKPPFYVHMFGQWMLNKREGFGWRGHSVTYTGKWEAAMTEPAAVKQSDGTVTTTPNLQQSNPVVNFFNWVFAVPQAGDPHGVPNFFVRILLFLLALGLGLVLLSVKMFGPAGLLNIWMKKEYIPSQFKSQWGKMLREFGKPIRPGGMPLGTRADWNFFNFYMPRKLNMPPEVRAPNPHMLVLGGGGKGKSRLIASMVAHDIESNERAVVVIDSDGSLVDLLVHWVASHPDGADMARRLIIVDPTHGSESMAYNPFEFPDDGDLQAAASSVVYGFKAIYTEPPGSQSQWNQQTANILRNAAILLMANGRTLTDLPVLLTENDFRDVLLEKVERMKNERPEYITLLEAWAQYKRLARTDQWINWVEPILNRVQPMLSDPRIRPILTKPKGDLNLKDIISEGKILLVKVPQGQLDNASLLGSLLVTGLKQAALSLSLKNSSSRKHPCALYLDELDNFIEKDTFDAITSETRKFQIGFVGAAKSLQDLPEDYRNKIVSGVGTMCCFSLIKKDGDMLGPQMFRVDGRKVKHQTLQNIFNKVNTAPQFELISDEEKLNIDRVVGQEDRTYFCYRVGTIAGVFQMKSPEFDDIPDKDINWTLVDQMYARSVPGE